MIYLELFWSFLKIGLFTIGGGYAMIPLISSTVVTKGWITQELFIDFIAIAESTPGPFAVNVATFVGNSVGGIFGGVTAVMGLFVPSFVIIFVIFRFSKKFMENKYIQAVFRALRPAVVALIINAFLSVALATFVVKNPETGINAFNWFGAVWFIVCFLLLRKFKKVHPVFLILLSAGVGILFYGVIV